MPADKSIETITLDEALELFKLPRTLGEYEGKDVIIGAGRFGPYVLHNRKYVSIPKDTDPLSITLDEAVALIGAKRDEDDKRHLKKFDEDPKLNYRLPKAMHAKAAELSLEQCMEIVNKTKKD